MSLTEGTMFIRKREKINKNKTPCWTPVAFARTQWRVWTACVGLRLSCRVLRRASWTYSCRLFAEHLYGRNTTLSSVSQRLRCAGLSWSGVLREPHITSGRHYCLLPSPWGRRLVGWLHLRPSLCLGLAPCLKKKLLCVLAR